MSGGARGIWGKDVLAPATRRLYGCIAIHSAHEPLEIDFVTFSFPQRKQKLWQQAFSSFSAVSHCFVLVFFFFIFFTG